MNRCISRTLAACWLALPLWAGAQNPAPVRTFPESAWRGTLQVVQPPNILIDGQPARLSPGARIRSTQNLLLLSASLVGQSLLVNYSFEPSGLVHEVWVLTPAEAALPRPKAPRSAP